MTRTFSMLLAMALAAAPARAELAFLGEYLLASETRFEGALVGGLSSLDYDPRTGRYWAISDDPGNDRPGSGPPRRFELAIEADATGIRDVSVTAMRVLPTPDGAPHVDGRIDPEALRIAPWGGFLWASEGVRQAAEGVEVRVDPAIVEMDAEGRYLRAFDLPPGYRVSEAGVGPYANFGFESLTLSPDGARVYAATENALMQDGPPPAPGVPGRVRLGVYDYASGAALAEYVYLADAPRETPAPPGARSFSGVVELLALADGRILALERQFTIGGEAARRGDHLIRLYSVRPGGAATNVLGAASLAEAAFTPLEKTLVADLNAFGPLLRNVEGMTLGPALGDGRRLLLFAADDNFAPEVPTQFLAFAVRF